MNKELRVSKENVNINNGKVIIDSDELANMIQSGEFNLEAEEEAGGDNCACVRIF